MTLESFYTAIKETISYFENAPGAKRFLQLIETAKQEKYILNKLTVLFEGYYQFLPDDSNAKKVFWLSGYNVGKRILAYRR